MPEKDELKPAVKPVKDAADAPKGEQKQDVNNKLFEDAYKPAKGEAERKEAEKKEAEKKLEKKATEPPSPEQVKALTVQPLLDRILSEQKGSREKADEASVRKKVAENKIGDLTVAELRLAMRLETTDKEFGKQTGLKCSEEAYKRATNFVNQSVINAHIDLAATQLRVRPGSPIPLSDVPTDANTAYAQRPETFAAITSNGKLNPKAVEELVRSGKLTQGLVLDPKGMPSESDLTKLQNSYDWWSETSDRLATNKLMIEGNGSFQVMTEILKLNKPNWKPPEDPAKLQDYVDRSNEVINLIFRVRNYAEAINSLNSIDGDFKNQALSKDNFPGEVGFDEKTKRLNRMVLNLPDSLEATPENERVLQKLRDWLDQNSQQVDKVMREYEKGAFVRYGDVQEKGNATTNDKGELKKVVDEKGEVTAAIKDGKLYQRNLLGQLVDGEGKPAPKDVLNGLEGAKTEHFDYITHKFDVKTRDNGDIEVAMEKTYYGDHFANYQNWFGLNRGTATETRVYKPDDYVAVQTQTGKLELVRADRLQEFKDVQAFFHHGAKIASAALDVGMIVSGSIGAKAAITAGRGVYVAINVGRVALGVGGFLDPTFRQMGETGQAIRDFRQKAILLDVTQGLARQGLGKIFNGGKMLFETKAAAEVAEQIAASARMKQIDTATRYVFGAADAVWIPLLSTEIHDRMQRRAGNAPGQKIDKAYDDTSGGVGNSLDQGFARVGDSNLKPADATARVFNVYHSTLGISDEPTKQAVKQRFDSAVGKLSATEEQRDAYRNDELIKVFQPSSDQLLALKKGNNHAIPRESKVTDREQAVGEQEKVAAAIGLLTTAEKNGKLPEDGVLAKRIITVPGYTYDVIRSAGDSTYVETVTVKPETVEQKVSLKDATKVLQEASLNATSPGTRMVAADALFRSGNLSTAKYAAVLRDILEKEPTNDATMDVKSKALRQLSDLISLRKLEESSSKATVTEGNYGLSSIELEGSVRKYMKSEKDADLRAFAGATLYASEFPNRDDKVAAYYKQFQESAANKGSFREALLKEMQTGLQSPLTGSRDEIDTARQARLRAASGLANFDGIAGEAAMRKDLDKALVECITFEDKTWYTRGATDRPDLQLTMDVINELTGRMSKLDAEQQKAVRKAALDVINIPHTDVRPNATDVEKLAEAKAFQQTFAAKLMIAGQHEQLFAGSDIATVGMRNSMASKMKDWLSKDQIDGGWGQYPEYRVAAIRTLGQMGDRTAGDLIADRLSLDTTKKGNDAFYERSPNVRTAAIDALYRLDEARFRKKASEVQGGPKFITPDQKPVGGSQSTVEQLLKYERDHGAVEMLYKIWDRSKRPDPESLDYADSVSRTIELLNNGSKIDVSGVVPWVQGNANLNMLDQNKLDAEALKRATDYLWSGFGGWLDQVFTGKETEHARERQRADNIEKSSLRTDRDNQLASLTQFGDKFKSADDRAMAIKTLLYLVRHQDQTLIEQKDQAATRNRASSYLKMIAEWQRDNKNDKDALDNKLQLSQAVVSALLDSSIDSTPEVKNNMLDALLALVSRDQGKVPNDGAKADDYLIITPERAGAIISQALEREYKMSPANAVLSQESKALQLKMLEQLHALRYHGNYGVLKGLSDPQTGSKHKEVQVRAQQVLGSLRDGVGWISDDTVPATVGSLGKKAEQMVTALQSDDAKYNYENTVQAIFAACKQEPIKYNTDPRIAVLKAAMTESKSERVKLAAAWMLSQSSNPEDVDAAASQLASLASDGSQPTYKTEAMSILSSMVSSSSKMHTDRAYKAWKEMYEQRKDKGFQAPPAIKDGKISLIPMQSAGGLPNYYWNSDQQIKDTICAVSGLSPQAVEARLSVSESELNPKPIRMPVYQSTIQCHQPQRSDSGFQLSTFNNDFRRNDLLFKSLSKDNKLTPTDKADLAKYFAELKVPAEPVDESDAMFYRRQELKQGKLESLKRQYGINDRMVRAQGARPPLALPRWQPVPVAPVAQPAGR